MQKYIGKIVQLIYIDSKRNVSIRNVRIIATGEESFKAYCYQAQNVRTFKMSGIVDIEELNPRIIGAMNNVGRYDKKSLSNTRK